MTRPIMKGLRGWVILVGIWIGMWGSWVEPAFAHAFLQVTTPLDGQVVETFPSEIVLQFNEPVQITKLNVLAPTGAEVSSLNKQTLPQAQVPVIKTPLPPGLPLGVYTVIWRSVSADFHPVRGSFVFQVGQGSGQDPLVRHDSASEPPIDGWRILDAGVRALRYLGLLGCVGIGGFWPLLSRQRTQPRFILGLVGVTLLTIGLGVLIQTQRLYGDIGYLDQLLATRYGISVETQSVGLLLLGGAAVFSGWVADSVTVVAAMVILASFGWIGHTATTSTPWFVGGLLWLHLCGSAFWLGGLWGLLQIPLGDYPRQYPLILRFSNWATRVVPGLILAGAGLGAIHLQQLDVLNNPYGQVLSGKILWVLAIVGLGAHNKFRVVPILQQGLTQFLRLRHIVRLELLGLVCVLLTTTLLVEQTPPSLAKLHGMPPPPPFQPPSRDCLLQKQIDPYEVKLNAFPCQAGSNLLVLLIAQGGKPVDIPEATLRFSLPAKEIGPIKRDLERSNVGAFVWNGIELSQPGTWEVEVTLLVSDFDEKRIQFSLPVAPPP